MAMKKQKLIFLGGEDVSARIEISKKFIALGYDIEIVGTQDEEIFHQNNIAYTRYALSRELDILNDIQTIRELRKILKNKPKGTIVHAFDTKPTMFLPMAAFGLKNVRVVRTITGMGRIFTEDNFKNSILKSIYNSVQKLVTLRVDFTVFQNDDDYEYFIDHSLVKNNNSAVIKSSGLNLQSFTTQVDKFNLDLLKKELAINENKTFILVSRMVEQKGIRYYLEAAKLCYENGYKYNFLLVGQLDTDGSISLEEIRKYEKYVKYLGRREDVKDLLQLSDIFVLPTYYREGVPRVLLEASALGLPLIATDMPGCRDVVIDEYNGKLIKTKDTQDLYEKMIYVAQSDKFIEYSKNAMEKVKEFDLDKVVERYDKVYIGIEDIE